MNLNNIIKDEVLYFYKHVHVYEKIRNIDIIIAEDIYKTILKYEMCDTLKEEVLDSKTSLNNLNGTFIFAPSIDKKSLVVLSKNSVIERGISQTRGTLIHELTHAHDHYDFANYLQLTDYNELYENENYTAFFFWTEFHARCQGQKRFLKDYYSRQWKNLKKQKKELLDGIIYSFNYFQSDKGRVYDFMQSAGRFYTLLELCPGKENFKTDFLLKINLSDSNDDKIIDKLYNIYNFLCNNLEFEQFILNIEIFNELINMLH